MRQNIYDDPTFFQGYQSLREQADNFNNLVEQPAFRAMLPPLAGKTLLDLGCGFGDLAVYCAGQGAARIVATDISEKMLSQAREQNGLPQIEYVQKAMEDLEFKPEEFDLVLSTLALHYVADYAGLVQNVARWLRPNGCFLFSVEHPIFTARKAGQTWLCDADGAKLSWLVDDYCDEGRREFTWYTPGVVKYHRALSTLLNTLMQSGLKIDEVQEPTASEATLERLPDYGSTRRVPSFFIIRSSKPLRE